ncbi:hypothetical protein DENSPDRAFT_657434 [Dentipellis sp. KUC8613]|nr:hypothetical protein DENSPDRAFT_657434 [Dentipellis sp. KUC8613]
MEDDVLRGHETYYAIGWRATRLRRRTRRKYLILTSSRRPPPRPRTETTVSARVYNRVYSITAWCTMYFKYVRGMLAACTGFIIQLTSVSERSRNGFKALRARWGCAASLL